MNRAGNLYKITKNRKNHGSSKLKNRLLLGSLCILLAAAAITGFLWFGKKVREGKEGSPDSLLLKYNEYLNQGDYKAMYGMLSSQSHVNISLSDFTSRNQNIYEGIGASDIQVRISGTAEKAKGKKTVSYQTSLDSSAGKISFLNQADFIMENPRSGEKGTAGYKLVWNDQVIFPNLGRSDKVRVSTDQAERGRILDRNGRLLAGKGTASTVGLVPGKMSAEASGDLKKLSGLLGISEDTIKKKLSAKWVAGDSLVPVKTVKKVDEFNLQSDNPNEENKNNKAIQDQLLTIPGVMITDTALRFYPLGAAASHLVGYVQGVTSEDLEQHKDDGYTTGSVIGKNGMESLFEKDLKGQNGKSIYIADGDGKEKQVLAAIPRVDGKDITLTIDSELQKIIYGTFQDLESCTVAMNPYTGEVLALVNTPSFDDNDFIMGMAQEKWAALNEDAGKPLYNRFRQRFVPGSTFKPITGAIGLTTGAITANENFGETHAGVRWQKDAGWGNYFVTTLHDYSPVNLDNAYIYSDNIYFARTALKIGPDRFTEGLHKLGFKQELPFEIAVAESRYSNTDKLESEVQLADSGYGQGEILVNPIHLASLYTMFLNEGSVVKPYLTYQKNPEPQYWLPHASSPETAAAIDNALKMVVSSEHGTGRAAKRPDITLAGKTGTAEIKATQEDPDGKELGWFSVYTDDGHKGTPLLLVSMVEDVKKKGGSGLVVRRSKAVLAAYLPPEEAAGAALESGE